MGGSTFRLVQYRCRRHPSVVIEAFNQGITKPDVTIVHPWDPWEQGIGGFDSFIDAFLRYCPPSLSLEVIGLTTNSVKRPIREWMLFPFADRQIYFMAAMEEAEPDRVQKIPLSLRFAIACRRHRIRASGKIVQFHRFESALGVVVPAHARRVFFLHNDPTEIRSSHSDVRWHSMSILHDRLLLNQLKRASAIVCVDPRTPSWIEKHQPDLDRPVIYQSKWADSKIYDYGDATTRVREQRELRALIGASDKDKIVLFVGRLESQKDPMLMLESFSSLQHHQPNTHLVIVGKGRLQRQIESKAQEMGITKIVHFLGAIPREKLPPIYRGADVLLCTSGYESGPLTVFESLACGTPVVSVNVGQVNRVLDNQLGIGRLVESRDSEHIATALQDVLKLGSSPPLPERCAKAVSSFTPQQAFASAFDLYHRWLTGSSSPQTH